MATINYDELDQDAQERMYIRNAIVFVVGALSILTSIFVAATIYTNEKMQKHPNYLILIFSVVNFVACYHLLFYMFDMQDSLCYLRGPQALALYLKPFFPNFTQLDALMILTEANTGLFEFW